MYKKSVNEKKETVDRKEERKSKLTDNKSENKKKSLIIRFNALSKAKKAQAIIAAALSVFLLIAIPTYAWFFLGSRVEILTRIKAPTTLDIRAGHAYSVEYLDLSDIDATDVDGNGYGHKDYIFAIKAGSSINSYDIQIAHTTNIPFTYTLYRASELGESGDESFKPEISGYVATFEYYDEDTEISAVYYYGYASNSSATEEIVNTENAAMLTLTDLNPNETSEQTYGRTIAEKFNGTDGIYSGYSKYIDDNGDDPQIYAVPLYSQHIGITRWDPDHDFYILRLSWNTNSDNTAFAEWNAAANNKETDLIYISAKASAGSN